MPPLSHGYLEQAPARFCDGYFWTHRRKARKLACFLEPPYCGALPLGSSLHRLAFRNRVNGDGGNNIRLLAGRR